MAKQKERIDFMFHILVVEDDAELRRLFCTVLYKNGYTCIEAEQGKAALDVLENHFIDLIICDVMMPIMDGYSFVSEIRAANFMQPVLMITAKNTFPDLEKGFHCGADDYMVKPIHINEMLLRVSALLKRAQINSEKRILIGETTLLYDSFSILYQKKEETLPQKEFLLLFKLLSSLNRIFTRQQLMDEIWGMDTETDPRTIDVHIGRLREKFRENSDFEIVTIRGLGYKAVKRA